jgi:transposase-like protein
VRYGREFWQQLVREVDDGAKVAEVARRHRVQPGTLSWWRWKLKTSSPARPMLLPVVVRSTGGVAAMMPPIELRIGDVVIRITGDTDVAYIAKLVDALRS